MALENKQFGKGMWGEGTQKPSGFGKRYTLPSRSKLPKKPQSKKEISIEKPKIPDRTSMQQFISSLKKQSGKVPNTGKTFKKEELAEMFNKIRKLSAKRGGTYNFYEKNKANILKDLEKTAWGKSQSERQKINWEVKWLKKQWKKK